MRGRRRATGRPIGFGPPAAGDEPGRGEQSDGAGGELGGLDLAGDQPVSGAQTAPNIAQELAADGDGIHHGKRFARLRGQRVEKVQEQ